MFEEGMSIGPIHVHLGKHRKSHTIVGLTEREDFFVLPRVLAPKLIAGKSEDLQSLCMIFFIEIFQPLKLRGESAF